MSKLVTSDNLKAYHGELAEHLQLLERDKAYLVGDIVKYDGLTLKCTIAGNTDVNKVDYSSIDVGDTIVDGTVTFTVIDPNSMWYEENKFYMVDDIVVYDDKFYKCITAHTATAIFDTTKWAELSTGGGVDLPEWQANISYIAGKYLVHEGTVYKVTTSFTSGTTFDDTNLSAYIAPVMTGATSSTNGTSGLVLAPRTSDISKFLCGDGTWKSAGGSGVYADKVILWQGTAYTLNETLTLSDDVNNYDYVFIYFNWFYNGVVSSVLGTVAIYDPTNAPAIDIIYPDMSAISGTSSSNWTTLSNNTFMASVDFSTSGVATITYVKNLKDPSTNQYAVCVSKIVGIKFLPNPNNYSITEQRIGTWIDGSPLYQKTLSVTSPGTVNADTIITNLNVTGIDKVLSIDGILVDAEYNYNSINACSISTSSLSSKDYIVSYINSNYDFRMTVSSNWYANCQVYATIKYTKV